MIASCVLSGVSSGAVALDVGDLGGRAPSRYRTPLEPALRAACGGHAEFPLDFEPGGAAGGDVPAILAPRPGAATRVQARDDSELREAAPVDLLATWMGEIAEGDERALGQLRERCVSRVFAAALRIVRRHEFAEEVTADCFWQVWREARRFDASRGSVMAWILTIARSRAIDALRRHEVSSRHETPLDDEMLDQSCNDAPCLATALDARRRETRVRGLLGALDPMHVQLLHLAFRGGLSHQEIADHSGLPLGTVKSRLRRSMASLRAMCDASGLAPGTA